MKNTSIKNIIVKHINAIFLLGMGLSILSGCKKFVEVPPPSTELTGAAIFSTNADAETAMAGLYTTMADNSSYSGGPNGISVLPGLSADEVALYPTTSQLATEAYQNALLANPIAPTTPFWADSYNLIYQANAAISGIPASSGMTPTIKNQFLGEALFIRAYCYFYLVNFYGGVPLVTTTNYQVNARLARSATKVVYQQIIADLTQAQTLLSNAYLDGGGNTSSEHVRPNLQAVNALLSRVYLYNQDWSDAEKFATKVISSGIYTLDDDLNQVFLANSQEAIWQLELPSNSSNNTQDGFTFVPPVTSGTGPNGAYSPYYMSYTLAKSFESGDQRKLNWVDSVTISGTTYYYPYKYKAAFSSAPPPVEYPMMLRYAEQYLIRAEAEAEDPSLGNAASDLNMIRHRAGLPDYSASVNGPILTAIMHERQVELFIENGHRWLDLKRTGLAPAVMGSPGNQCALKGGAWNNDAELYPVPYTELKADNNLVQNPGYN